MGKPMKEREGLQIYEDLRSAHRLRGHSLKDTSDKNQQFWSELCGTHLAQRLGITDASSESLRKYDEAYFKFYSYLLPIVRPETMNGKKVLDVGLGYGPLGQKMVEAGAIYTGMDITRAPCEMMLHRINLIGKWGTVVQGDFLTNDFHDNLFDVVVGIGTPHHTGDVLRCIREIHRVLKPGGRAVVMVHNTFSLRWWLRWPKDTLKALFSQTPIYGSAEQRGAYDYRLDGSVAPSTQFSSVKMMREAFSRFSKVKIVKRNTEMFGRSVTLWLIGPFLGLDIYITAEK